MLLCLAKKIFFWMAITVVRMDQCTLVCHPDISKVNHHFPWRENELELSLLPQAFHPLIPSPHYSRTLRIAGRQQVCPSAQLLWDAHSWLCSAQTCFLQQPGVIGILLKNVPQKTPCWSCLGSLVLRRVVLLKPWANNLFSCIRSLNWYFHFLSLPTFSNSSFFKLTL